MGAIYLATGGGAIDEISNKWKRFLYIALHGPLAMFVYYMYLFMEIIDAATKNWRDKLHNWFRK
jgi:hypothetical protein